MANQTSRTSQKQSTPHSIGRLMDADLLAAAKSSAEQTTRQQSWPSVKAAQYVFDYDDETISELERAIAQASVVEPPGGDS
jgi:hypothetical protein